MASQRRPRPASPLTASAVELAVLERGGLVESAHLGHAIVLGPGGAPLAVLGDAETIVYPRSALKPLQAIAVRRLGTDLEGEELVLASASHRGTADHRRVVEGMLREVGLDADALLCPPDPTRLAMNCSGKHAAFLRACVHRGWSTGDYLDPAHPLQRHVLDTVAELCGESPERVTVDGCGAPLPALTLHGLARGLWAASDDPDGRALFEATRAHPWAIDGPGTANTVVIERLGVFAKRGAEGVLMIVAGDRTTLALKIVDGSDRAALLIGLGLLADLGVIDAGAAEEVAHAVTPAVLGGGRPMGALRLP